MGFFWGGEGCAGGFLFGSAVVNKGECSGGSLSNGQQSR